jgi:hypothetical protein
MYHLRFNNAQACAQHTSDRAIATVQIIPSTVSTWSVTSRRFWRQHSQWPSAHCLLLTVFAISVRPSAVPWPSALPPVPPCKRFPVHFTRTMECRTDSSEGIRRQIHATNRELLESAGGLSASQLWPLLQEALSTLGALQPTWAEFSTEEVITTLDVMQLVRTLSSARFNPAHARTLQWLDQPSAMVAEMDATRRGVIYKLVHLSKDSGRIPSSLYTHGVEIGPVRDPSRTGGFADVFEGVHYGRAVALKRLRMHGLAHPEIHKVRRFARICIPLLNDTHRASLTKRSYGASCVISLY